MDGRGTLRAGDRILAIVEPGIMLKFLFSSRPVVISGTRPSETGTMLVRCLSLSLSLSLSLYVSPLVNALLYKIPVANGRYHVRVTEDHD